MNNLVVKTVAAFVALGWVVTTPEAAIAGEWVLDRYEASGSNVIDPPIANKPNPEIWPAPAAGDTSYGAYTSAEKSSSGGSATFSASAKSSGTITAVFKWIPGIGQTLATDPPPAYLNLLVQGSAGSYTRHSVNGAHSLEAQTNLNNGLKSANQTRVPTNDSVGINSKQLVRVPAGSEEVSVSYGLSSDNKIICTPTKLTGYSGYTYYNASGYVGIDASVWMKAQEDDRNVWITRSDAPVSKQKGAPGVVIDETKDEWVM